jgi:hypothetical protein
LGEKKGRYGMFWGCPKFESAQCKYTEDWKRWARVEISQHMLDRELTKLLAKRKRDLPTPVIDVDSETETSEESAPRRSTRAKKPRTDLADFIVV